MPLNIQSNIDPQTGLPMEVENSTNDGLFKSPNIVSEVGSDIQLSPEFGEYKRDFGFNPMDEEIEPGSLNKYRANVQTGWELAGKAIGQGATEASLGALEGVGYALDFEEIFNSDKQAEEGFDNWFSKAIRETKEDIQEDAFGIYQTEQAQSGTLGQKMSDGTWWASQGKTMGTTLSLMIPSMGVGRAVSALGKLGRASRMGSNTIKGMKAGKSILDAQNAAMKAEGAIGNVLNGVAAGAFSRKAESAMEANQKFQESYEWWKNSPKLQEELLTKYESQVKSIDKEIDRLSNTLINPAQEDYQALEAQRQAQLSSLQNQRNSVKDNFDNDLEGMARSRAGEEAAKVFRANAAMAPIDMAQYMLMLKPFTGFKGAIEAVKKSTAGKIVGTAVAQPLSEGLEEGYQFVAGEEASASVREDKDMFGEGFGDRMSKYAKDPHFHESVALGAMMGLVFDAGGTAIQKATEKLSKDSDKADLAKNEAEHRRNAVQMQSGTIMRDFLAQDTGLIQDKVDKSIDDLNSIKEQVTESDISEEEKTATVENIDKYIERVDYVKQQEAAIATDDRFQNPDVKNAYLSVKLMDQITGEELNHSTEMLSNEISASGLSSDKAAILQADLERKQLVQTKNRILKDQKLNSAEKTALNNYVTKEKAKLDTSVKTLIEAQKAEDSDFKISDLTSSNLERIDTYTKDKSYHNMMKNGVLPTSIKGFTGMSKAEAESQSNKAETKNRKELETIFNAKAKSSNTPEELRLLNGEIEQKYPGQFTDIIKSNENKAKNLDSKAKTTEVKAKNEFSLNNFNKQVEGAKTKDELIKLRDDLKTFNPPKNTANKLKTDINKKIAAVQKAESEVPEVKIVTIKAGSNKGQEVKILSESKSGKTYKVEFEDGRTASISKANLAEEQKPLFNDKGDVQEDLDNILTNDVTEEMEAGAMTFEDMMAREDAIENQVPETGEQDPAEINSTTEATKETELIDNGIEPNTSTEKILLENESEQVEDSYPPMHTDEDLEQAEEVELAISSDNDIKAIEYVPNVFLTTRAKVQNTETGNDEYDSTGKIKLEENYDPSMASAENYAKDSEVVLMVNEQNIKDYITGLGKKLTAENIPISVMSKEDIDAGKKPYISIRDLSNPAWKKMNPDAHKKTMALRQSMYDSYAINGTTNFYTTVISKDGGHTNKASSYKPLREALFINDKGYTGTIISSANQDRQIPLPDGFMAINKNVPPGMPHLIIDNAIGDKVGIPLDISEIQYNEGQAEIVNTVFGIIEEYILKTGIGNDFDVHEEVGKYLYLFDSNQPHYKEKTNPRNEGKDIKVQEYNNLFGLTESEGVYKIFLPNKTGYKVYKAVNNNGQLQVSTFDMGKERPSTKGELVREFNKRLVNMKPNVVNQYGQNPNEFNALELKDGKLVRSENKHYYDFLSEVSDIRTRVTPVQDAEGNVYYTTQPGIQIDENISNEEQVEVAKETPAQVQDVDIDQGVEDITEDVPVESAEVDELDVFGAFDDDADFPDANEVANESLADVVDYNAASLSSFSNMDSLEQEQDLVNTMLGFLLKYMDAQTAKGLPVNINNALSGVLKSIKSQQVRFEKHSNSSIDKVQAKKDGVSAYFGKNKTVSDTLNHLINNFEESRNEDGTYKFIGYRKKIEMEYRTLAFKAAEETEENVIDNGENEKSRHVEGANYKTDPEKSASAQIKRFLSNVPKMNANGRPKSNTIGQPVMEEFGMVFNYLMENLSNIEINDILNELEELSASNMVAKGALNNLNNIKDKNPEILNKFLSVMKKQKSKFLTFKLAQQKTNEGTTVQGQVIDSNRTGTKDVIKDKWRSMFKDLGLKSKLLSEKDGKMAINKKAATKLNNDFSKATDSIKTTEDKQAIIDIFKQVGISFSMQAFDKLELDYQNREYRKHFQSMFGNLTERPTFESFFKGAFSMITGDLNNKKDPFVSQTKRIVNLAIYEQKFDMDASKQSFRNGKGDMLYAFTNPHHLSNTVDNVKSNESFTQKFKDDSFAKHSTWLDNTADLDLAYYDSSKNGKKGSQAKEYQEQNDHEKEVTKVNLYLNNNNGKYSYTFGPSPSDKTTFGLLKHARIDTSDIKFINDKLFIPNAQLELLYDLLVQSEIDRINQTVADFEAANNFEAKEERDTALNKLMQGYHYHNGQVGAGAYFFMLPELNSIMARNTDGSIIKSDLNIESAKEEIRSYFEKEAIKKQDYWKSNDLLSKFDGTSLGKRKNSHNLAIEYAINSAASYANQYMLLTGDPARFAKIGRGHVMDFNNWKPVISGTLPNMFKRIAKDIAPGSEGVFEGQDKQYRIAFIDEPIKSSVLAKGLEKSPYKNIDLADAQEWTTLEEHAKVLHAFGMITKAQRDDILANRNNLTWQQIGTVMQPLKPVQVLAQSNKDFHALTDYYIKTSSFPLIPQLTKGFPQLEKMRKFMEENNVDRMVPKTAVKLGYHNKSKLFENGEFLTENDFNANKLITLDRSGFRIQQDIPYSRTKSKIGEGSQLRKLMFADLDPGWKFLLNGEIVDGVHLKELSDNIHSEFYKRKSDKLMLSLDVDSSFTIKDLSTLRDLMVDEALGRGFGHNDVMTLNTMKLEDGRIVFDIPLFFNPMVHKIESLLNSVVKNKILKTKLPGKSYVQGSALGFDVQTEDFIKSVGGDVNGVILTKDYKGELDYREDENGLYAEVFMPSHFKGVDITKHIGSDGLLDASKIDPKLLDMIGYRIPTQGFNSMIKLKVVGLLPEVAGDLIIVPPAMAVQMGSDFDVDKLYVHNYNYKVEDNGTVSYETPIGDIKQMSDEQIQNKLMESYNSVLSNKQVGDMAKKPLDNEDVADVIKKVDGLKPEFAKDEDVEYSTINDDLHTRMIETQVSGQLGVAITSVASTFHALSQYAGLYIKPYKNDDKEMIYPSIRFSKTPTNEASFSDSDGLNKTVTEEGDIYSPKDNSVSLNHKYEAHAFKGAFRLDKTYGFFKDSNGDYKRISDVLKNLQTEAVDNANNGRLYGMHLNRDTFGPALLIARAGFDENTIGLFLNQPVIKAYIQKMKSINNYFESDFSPNKKFEATSEFLAEYFGDKLITHSGLIENISLEEMEAGIAAGEVGTDFQLNVIQNFMQYDELAMKLQIAQSALNTDTKYLGSNIAGVITKKDRFEKNIVKNKHFGNVFNLYSGTTAGAAYDYGVSQSLALFGEKNLLPYDSKLMMSTFEDIAEFSDKDLTEKEISDISIGIRSSLWGSVIRNVFPEVTDIKQKRTDLAYGDNNLATRVNQAKLDYPNNTFIQSLNPQLPFDINEPVSIEHYSSKDNNAVYDYKKQQGWLKLLNSPKDSKEYQLGFDLFIWSVTFGTERTARDFGRFIPVDFLNKSGLTAELREVDFSSGEYQDLLASNFIRQYFQHYPNKLPGVAWDSMIKKVPSDKIDINSNVDPDSLPLYVKHYNKDSKEVMFYERIGDQYILGDRLGFGEFVTEYDLSTEMLGSMIKNNLKGVQYKKSTKVAEKRTPEDQISGEYLLEEHRFDEGIGAVLDSIHESNTEYMDLANYFFSKLESIPSWGLERHDTENEVHHVEGEEIEVRGRTIPSRGDQKVRVMTINPVYQSDLLRFQRTFLHETSHVFTIELFNSPDSQLTEKQIEARNKIINIFNNLNGKDGIAYDKRNDKKVQNAFRDIKEFIAELLVNKDLQNLLNNTTYQKTTIFDRLKKLISQLFGDVKSGSALEASLHSVMDMLESDLGSVTQSQVIQESSISNESVMEKHAKLIERYKKNCK